MLTHMLTPNYEYNQINQNNLRINVLMYFFSYS